MSAGVSRRGTSSKDAQGSSTARRARKAWLVETYRADVDLLVIEDRSGTLDGVEIIEQPATPANIAAAELALLLAGPDLFAFQIVPAARCYRSGTLVRSFVTLSDGTELRSTIQPDRIIPGCLGGTYRRENIRPACGPCNMTTGGALGAARRTTRARGDVAP